MGWMRTLFLGDIGNRLDIADTERDIDDIRGRLSAKRNLDATQDRAIAQLQRENEQLELCVASLVRTLQGKGVLTETDVQNFVDMIDDE